MNYKKIMSNEQEPAVPEENSHEVHKTDDRAIRELGGFATKDSDEPNGKTVLPGAHNASNRNRTYIDSADPYNPNRSPDLS